MSSSSSNPTFISKNFLSDVIGRQMNFVQGGGSSPCRQQLRDVLSCWGSMLAFQSASAQLANSADGGKKKGKNDGRDRKGSKGAVKGPQAAVSIASQYNPLKCANDEAALKQCEDQEITNRDAKKNTAAARKSLVFQMMRFSNFKDLPILKK